jgi:hypothetical protein
VATPLSEDSPSDVFAKVYRTAPRLDETPQGRSAVQHLQRSNFALTREAAIWHGSCIEFGRSIHREGSSKT